MRFIQEINVHHLRWMFLQNYQRALQRGQPPHSQGTEAAFAECRQQIIENLCELADSDVEETTL